MSRLPTLVEKEWSGYSDFERVHRVVLSEKRNCDQCHAELSPFDSETHHIDRLAPTTNCRFCHVAEERIVEVN